MMSRPSRSCASSMISGGFVKNVFQRTKVYSPSSPKKRPSAVISSEAPFVGRHRLVRVAAADDLTQAEKTDGARGAQRGVLALQFLHPLPQHLPHVPGVLQQTLFLVDRDRGQGRCAGQGVAVVRQAPGEGPFLEDFGDVGPQADGSQLDVRGGEALGHGDDVWHDVPVIDGEPATSAPEAGHHLVSNEEDAVAVADLPHALQIAIRRNEETVGSHHGLHDERGDVRAALVADDVLQLAQADVQRFGLAVPPPVEFGGSHDARDARLGGPAPWISGERQGPGGAAVVGAVAHQDLVPARHDPRYSDGVLDGFGAPVREEEGVDVPGSELGELDAQPGPGLGGHERVGVGQGGGLLLDRLPPPWGGSGPRSST